MASNPDTLEQKETLEHTLESNVRRILILQLSLAMIVASVILVWWVAQQGWPSGWERAKGSILGLLYGALVGMVGTMLSKRAADRSSRAIVDAPRLAMLPVYLGLVNKLLIVGGGLAFGPIFFGLGPILVVSGYLVSQAAFVWVAVRRF